MNIADVTEIVKSIFNLEIEMRIISAIFLGFAIGLEREITNKYAGLRTNILVCVGSCIFTILSIYGFPEVSVLGDELGTRDTARVAAQVVTGIGFIGGGTVLRHGANVFGLTTAATLWVSAAIGMACGTGMYGVAIMSTIFTIIVLVMARVFEKTFLRGSSKNKKRIKVKLSCVTENADEIYGYIVDNFTSLVEINKKQSTKLANCTNVSFTADVNVKSPVKTMYKEFEKLEGLEAITIIEPDELG